MTPFYCQMIPSSCLCKCYPGGCLLAFESPFFQYEYDMVFFTECIHANCSCCSYVYLSDSDAGHQGSSLSNHRKTTGFGPFKLPTHSPVQKGRDHSPPKAFLEESSSFIFFLVSRLFWILCILQAQPYSEREEFKLPTCDWLQ